MQEQTNTIKRTFFVTGKIFLIGFLMLLLLIPLALIENLVSEREQRRNEAVREISQSWGGEQLLAGPVLVVPYKVHEFGDVVVNRKVVRKETGTRLESAYFMPQDLSVKATLDPQTRYRGIYQATLYVAGTTLTGTLAKPDFTEWGIADADIQWEKAYALIGITDLSTIQGQPKINIFGKEQSYEAATSEESFVGQSLKIPLKNLKTDLLTRAPSFDVKINFSGSGNFRILPIGDSTRVSLTSTWPHPSFVGTPLPVERSIQAHGFDAVWSSSYIGREFPRRLNQKLHFQDYDQTLFGVRLVIPVDVYQVATRSVKYGNLYIFLTFAVFFLFEILCRLRIHPIQYLLVGFALALFYLLLLALSEHIAFAQAYLIAAIGITSLLTYYSYWVLHHVGRSFMMSGLIGSLFGFLYILLCAEDYSLLMGASGLVLMLAAVMFVTRRLDWYQIGSSEDVKV